MKILILLIFSITTCYSQIGEYGQLKKNKQYQSYTTKDGNILKIGDVIHINTIDSDHYNYISQGGSPGGTILSNKDVIISKLKAWAYQKQEPYMFVGFKGYGMVILYIDYENALQVGEIYDPNAKLSKYEALAILKEKKELLDLEIITQSEYNKFKDELTPIILSEN